MTPPTTTPPLNNAFLEALQELAGGSLLADLNRAMIDLVGSVRSVGKGGKLTLTLTVAPAKGNTQTLFISEEIAVKAPKPDRESTIMFADDNNRLSRRDPRQPRLPEMADGKARAAEPDIREFPRAAATGETPQ